MLNNLGDYARCQIRQFVPENGDDFEDLPAVEIFVVPLSQVNVLPLPTQSWHTIRL